MTHSASFQATLLERQRALMSHELMAMRQELLGSDIIVSLDKQGKIGGNWSLWPPHLVCEGAPDVTDYDYGDVGTQEFFERVSQFVTEVAYGEAALRSRGLLPPLTRTSVKSATAALKASKPDYTAYFKHMDSKPVLTAAQEADRIKGNKDVQVTFDKINATFVSLAEEKLSIIGFPRNDLIHTLPQATIDKALLNVKPLSARAQALARAQDGSSLPPLELLQQYHERGVELRDELAKQVRAEANAEFASAATLQGNTQAKAYRNVIQKYMIAASCLEHAPVAYCNIAAVNLLQKNFRSAVDNSEKCLAIIRHRLSVPLSYKGQRAKAITIFRTGELPLASQSHEVDARKRVESTLLWKALMRSGRGLVGLYEEEMEGERVMDHARIQVASDLRDSALAAFASAYKVDPTDKTPKRESKALDASMNAHIQRAMYKETMRLYGDSIPSCHLGCS